MPASKSIIHTQGSFLGGQWDTTAQGRIDHPWHKAALNSCLNALPVESGAWIKRSGTQWLGPTYHRLPAVVRPFFADSGHRYAVVLTTDGSAGYAHLFHEDQVLTNSSNTVATSSSSSGTLTVVTSTATGWSVNDTVYFTGLSAAGAGYMNRWLTITAIAGTTITLKDDQSPATAFSFDSAYNALSGVTIYRIVRLSTGFLSNIETAQIVNLGIQVYGGPLQALLLCQGYAPQILQLVAGTPDAVTLTTATFIDGPYLDQQGTWFTPETGTVSAYSGSITFTPASTTFSATDVGRLIRLYSEPAAWASATTYTSGDFVTYNGKWWKFTYSSNLAGVIPGTLYYTSGIGVMPWSPAPTAGSWAYGTITAQATTSCTVSLSSALNSANGATIKKWRLGVYTGGTSPTYPTTGVLHEGRLYLGGGREGRIDASIAGSYLGFAPTDAYGNVFDDYAIGLYLSSPTQDHIKWFRADRAGLLFGTVAEEYLLTGGAGQNDIITPTNFLIRRMSSYGGKSPASTTDAGFSVIFVQTGGKAIYEYVSDAFTSAPSGRALNEFSRGLIDQFYGIEELGYTETPVPIVWSMTGDGLLLTCTYRRFSRFMSSPPDMAGWALHYLADLRRVAHSICVLSNPDQSFDSLYITTTTSGAINAAGPANGVELMRPVEPA